MRKHELVIGETTAYLEPVENLLEFNAKVLFDRHSNPNMKDAPVLDYQAFTHVVESLTALEQLDERMLYQGIQRYLMEAAK